MRRALATVLLAAAPTALAQPMGPWLEEDDEPELVEVEDTGGAELPFCHSQVLRGGVQLSPMPELYKRWYPDKAWGTPDMIEVLTTAAEEMAWLKPDADPIVVGDISNRRGGPMDGHKSHRGGIDADIGLYWGDGRMHMMGFRVVSPQDLDAQSNWLLIRSMLETGHVERILLDNRLINKIRRHVIKTGQLSSEEAWEIFPNPANGEMWRLEGVVHHAPSHRHHMHVRVSCPE